MDAGTEINSYRPDTHSSGLRENLFLTNLLSGTKICVEVPILNFIGNMYQPSNGSPNQVGG